MFRDNSESSGGGSRISQESGHADDAAVNGASPVPEGERAGTAVSEARAPERRPCSEQPPQALPAIVSEPASAGVDKAAGAKRRAGRGKLKLSALALIAALGLGAGSYYGYHWLTVGRYVISTDDAYVSAHNTTLAAKVPGYLTAIVSKDNARVHAGDTIARIDDGDYRLAVQSARDKLATQNATVERLSRQIAAGRANVDQAAAQLSSAEAGRTQAELEFNRQQALVAKGFASRQVLDKVRAQRDQAVAAVKSADAALTAAKANIDVLKAQQVEESRKLDELKTSLAKAERDLSFTVVRAPIDGVIGNRAVQTGDYVQPGERLASLVPLDDIYINANFKETQLSSLKPGQPVDINIDALPDVTLHGTVESLAPASGSVFSLLPPDNATGNFTKIVQRLPVRISVPSALADTHVLRPGMSVVVSVNTRHETNGVAASATERRIAAQ